MKLSVVIVNYNVRYYVEQCIDSVLRATKAIDTEIFVVDNHSHDDSLPYLRQRFDGQVFFIESNHNLGFSRANNMAIRQSAGEYVLLLNPDTFVTEHSLQQVIDFMDNTPHAGGCGVMMHNADGTRARESRRSLPTPFVSLLKMLGRSDRYYMSHLPWDKPGQIEVISGAFFMLRRSVLSQTGLLDEDFFMYGEDIDLSYRIVKDAGYENWYVPAPILHYKGESTHKSSFRYVHVFYQAMLIFFRKHYGHLSFFVTLPIKAAIYLRAFIALMQMGYDQCKKSLGFIHTSAIPLTYIFIGSEQMHSQCRELARRKALTAQFVATRSEAKATGQICMVYDTSTYTYSYLLQESYQHAQENILIGTYNPATHVLITPFEVIL